MTATNYFLWHYRDVDNSDTWLKYLSHYFRHLLWGIMLLHALKSDFWPDAHRGPEGVKKVIV